MAALLGSPKGHQHFHLAFEHMSAGRGRRLDGLRYDGGDEGFYNTLKLHALPKGKRPFE
jgi:hypothetical protein